MRLLILYHSNILPPKPGADEHIYTTGKMLSKTYDVTILTWGAGESRKFEDRNLKIIHIGDSSDTSRPLTNGKIPNVLVDILSYVGARYIPFLRKARGPTVKQFNSLKLGIFDIAIRINSHSTKSKYILFYRFL